MKIEYFWNAIYYILWKWHLLHALSSANHFHKFIAPIIPKRFWTKAMRNPEIVVDYYRQKDRGLCHGYASIILTGIAAAYSLPIMGSICGLLTRWNIGNAAYWLSTPILVLAWYVSDKLVFKNNKYLKYFPQFEKKPKKWKYKWSLITLVVCLGALPMLYVFVLTVDLIYHI